jgi:acetyl esterase/lipase
MHNQRPYCLAHHWFALVLLAMLSGCSALGALNSVVPEGGFERSRNIVFGPENRNTLDVYVPRATSSTQQSAKPVIVFFYGGAWEMGDKESYLFMAEALVSQGFVVVVPDYRLFPQITFPTYMDDAARATKWALDNAARYGGDPNHVFVMGHSAGAQLAALIGFDNRYLTRVGADRAQIRGVVSLAGPLDFLPLTEPNLFKIFPESVRDQSQPINFIDGKQPPTLLMHGLADKRVGIHNSRNLAQRIRERGGKVEETYYPEMSHAAILVKFASPFRDERILSRVGDFVRAQQSR